MHQGAVEGDGQVEGQQEAVHLIPPFPLSQHEAVYLVRRARARCSWARLLVGTCPPNPLVALPLSVD